MICKNGHITGFTLFEYHPVTGEKTVYIKPKFKIKDIKEYKFLLKKYFNDYGYESEYHNARAEVWKELILDYIKDYGCQTNNNFELYYTDQHFELKYTFKRLG